MADYSLHSFLENRFLGLSKGRLRATLFESAETLHLVLLCYFGDDILCQLIIRW